MEVKLLEMANSKKALPVVLLFGVKEKLSTSLKAEINELPIDLLEINSASELENISTESELILILANDYVLDQEGVTALDKLRRKKNSDAYLIIFASKNSNINLSLIEDRAYAEVLNQSFSPKSIKNKIIYHLDYYERRKELSLSLVELGNNAKRMTIDGQKINVLTNAFSEPIIFINQDLKIKFWNAEAESFFGYSKFEVVNESFLRWLVAPKSHSEIKTLINDVKRSGSGILKREQTFFFRNKLGVEIKAGAKLSYLKIDIENFNLVFVIHNKSKERKLEKETLRARELREENKLMRELLNHVSHELRTPLNAIVGISKTLLSYNSANLTERQNEGIDLIQKSGEQLLGLIKDLLEISRIEANKLSLYIDLFDFDKLLSLQKTQTLNLIGKKNIKLVLKRSPAIPNTILGDQKKINQILTNVLGNAVKYTTKGKIVLSSHLIDNKLYFEVSDTGVGIPKEKLTSIFEKFKRLESNSQMAPGTGLGLHITKKLIELMNGEIKADSELGQGTNIRFFVTLPDEVKPIKPVPIQIEIESNELRIFNYSPNKKLILVIDDSMQNSFIYSILSEQDKFSVALCNSSKKVLSTAYEYMPDLIILKLEMPGLHGSSIIKELRRKEIVVPIIAFSEYEKYATDLPANTILLEEPMSLESLFPVLHERIKWEPRKYVKGVVIIEEDPWFVKEKGEIHNYIELFNNEEELSYVKLCQHRIDYLIIENVDKNSNGLELFLKLINENQIASYKKIILHHEANPMKYLADKIKGYTNVAIMTKKEILNEYFS